MHIGTVNEHKQENLTLCDIIWNKFLDAMQLGTEFYFIVYNHALADGLSYVVNKSSNRMSKDQQVWPQVVLWRNLFRKKSNIQNRNLQ